MRQFANATGTKVLCSEIEDFSIEMDKAARNQSICDRNEKAIAVALVCRTDVPCDHRISCHLDVLGGKRCVWCCCLPVCVRVRVCACARVCVYRRLIIIGMKARMLPKLATGSDAAATCLKDRHSLNSAKRSGGCAFGVA